MACAIGCACCWSQASPTPASAPGATCSSPIPSVDLVHFTILRPPEKQDGTPIRELSLIAFPIRELFEVKLNEFDLIIFDRYRQRGVLPQPTIEKSPHYVRKGGALLESAGPSYASRSLSTARRSARCFRPSRRPMSSKSGFKPQVTDLGRRHPVTADLPGRKARSRNGDAGSASRCRRHARLTVMSGTAAARCWCSIVIGEGRVAQILSDQIWLWSRGFEGGGPQAELLRRLAHWLMKEPDLEEEDLRAAVHDGKLEITRRTLAEETPEVQVTMPSGAKRTLRLEKAGGGRWTAVIPADEMGLYRVDNDPLRLRGKRRAQSDRTIGCALDAGDPGAGCGRDEWQHPPFEG